MENQNSIKVLLVEDDDFLRGICAKKLTKEGFIVSEVKDGGIAFDECKKFCPDIILLDIMLPVLDGFAILDQIKKCEDQTIARTPVIMLSNLGQDSDVQKAKELGAANYLVKAHFTTDEIVKKIREVLAK